MTRGVGGRLLHTMGFRRRRTVGAPPGTLEPISGAPRPVVRVVGFGPAAYVEQEITDPDIVRSFVGQWPVLWVDVDALGDLGTIVALGEIFGLHRLALEDVVNVHQRAKVDRYADHYFIVARMVTLTDRVETEQVTLFLGEGFVVTFQERPGDCFDPVRERIRKKLGRVREAAADYLAYVLLDALVDSYFPVLEQYGDRLEQLEEEALGEAGRATAAQLHAARRDLFTVRRAIWPLREALGTLQRDPAAPLSEETRLHLRDLYDHTIQVIDLVETLRELVSGLMDVYLSSMSHRMNEVMKVLTVIATIFIPLTFITGIYGMNFDPAASPFNMPELGWRWGYVAALALMAVVSLGLVLFFRRKGWVGERRPRNRGRDR